MSLAKRVIDQDERNELAESFLTFNRLSAELATAYRTLQEKVERMTAELEKSRCDGALAAQAAENAAARLRSLLATLPAGVVVVDEGGIVQECNPAASAILGRDVCGAAWADVVADTFRDPPQGGDWSTRDGRRVTIAASALAQGARVFLITDVTETRSLQELVGRSQRLSAIGRTAASLAHQIRTPLAGALLYFSQARSRCADLEQAALLDKGIDRLRHLDRLVQDMLVFARGKGPGERVRVADLFRAVHDAAIAVRPPSAHLVIDGTDALVELEGNRTALTAALVNLVTNAFEARPDVVVTMRARQHGDRVEITVEDNGPGIAPSIRSRVFEPFFSTRPTGTGLGLAVVKTVAEAHGGALALESEPNRGTRIAVELPQRAPDEPAPVKPALAREVA